MKIHRRICLLLSLVQSMLMGFGVVISSDCHYKEKMDCYFTEAAELLKSCGYKEKHILTKDGFIPVPL